MLVDLCTIIVAVVLATCVATLTQVSMLMQLQHLPTVTQTYRRRRSIWKPHAHHFQLATLLPQIEIIANSMILVDCNHQLFEQRMTVLVQHMKNADFIYDDVQSQDWHACNLFRGTITKRIKDFDRLYNQTPEEQRSLQLKILHTRIRSTPRGYRMLFH